MPVWSSVATRKASCFLSFRSRPRYEGVRAFGQRRAVKKRKKKRRDRDLRTSDQGGRGGSKKKAFSHLELHQRRVVVVLRLERRRLPEVRLVPVRPELDASLGVGQSLAHLRELQERSAPVAVDGRELAPAWMGGAGEKATIGAIGVRCESNGFSSHLWGRDARGKPRSGGRVGAREMTRTRDIAW
jgi:hypothetical protein